MPAEEGWRLRRDRGTREHRRRCAEPRRARGRQRGSERGRGCLRSLGACRGVIVLGRRYGMIVPVGGDHREARCQRRVVVSLVRQVQAEGESRDGSRQEGKQQPQGADQTDGSLARHAETLAANCSEVKRGRWRWSRSYRRLHLDDRHSGSHRHGELHAHLPAAVTGGSLQPGDGRRYRSIRTPATTSRRRSWSRRRWWGRCRRSPRSANGPCC